MSDIGLQNLYEALGNRARVTIQGNWKVGAVPTTTSIPVLLRNPADKAVDLTGSASSSMVGATIEFTSGANIGVSRTITAVASDGTLTLDTALATAPTVDDLFTILELPVSASGATSNTNIKEVGGTAQTGADWTPLFSNVSDSTGALGDTPPTKAIQTSTFPLLVGSVAHGTAVTSGTPVLTTYTTPAIGTVNVMVAIESAASGSTFLATVDGTNYHALNAGGTLSAGDLYSFSLVVNKSDGVNFEFGTSTTIGAFRAIYTAE